MRALLALALLLGLVCAAPAQQVIPATQSTVSITGSVGTQQIIAPITGLRGYIVGLLLLPVATSTVQIIAGTGATCGTGTVNLTGVMTFPGAQELSIGNGNGAIIAGPLSAGICIVIGTAVAPGVVAVAQL